MTKDEIDTMIKVLTFLLTAVTFYLAYRFGTRQLMLNTRNTLQSLLLDLNKAMLADPELGAVYDRNAVLLKNPNDPATRAKLESFIYMKLNTFDVVFAYYHDSNSFLRFVSKRLMSLERGSLNAWMAYFKEFIQGSSMAREILLQEKTHRIYGPYFNVIAHDTLAARELGE